MSLRRQLGMIAASLAAMLRTRLELFGLELAEVRGRLFQAIGLAFAAAIFLTLALLVFSLLVAVWFWATEYRYLALGLLALFYAVLGVWLLLSARRQLDAISQPFAATIQELGRDADALGAAVSVHVPPAGGYRDE